MMISKYAVSLLFICIFLLGCNSEDEQCSSPEVQTSIHNILTENTLKLTHKKRDEFFDGPALFGLDKIKATLALINIVVDHIKFVKRIQETQAVVCEAQLKITVPPPLLDDVDLTRRIQHQSKIIDFAKQLNIENHLNAFTQKVNYSVKSSKDITTVSVGFEGTQWEQLLDEMVTAVLLMSTLDANEVQPQAQAQAQRQPQAQHQRQPQAQRQTTVQRPEPIITKSKVIEVQPVSPPARLFKLGWDGWVVVWRHRVAHRPWSPCRCLDAGIRGARATWRLWCLSNSRTRARARARVRVRARAQETQPVRRALS